MEQNIGGTPDGRLWMMKALDPAGQNVEVRGMPDVENHTCAILNYQTQTQMNAPNLYKLDPSNNITYDGDLYMFQHPLVFGSGVTYPSGTVDPLFYGKTIAMNFGGVKSGDDGSSPWISFQSGSSALFPRTSFVAKNEQLGVESLKDLNDAWQNVSQRHRVIYGATQLVPTCSVNDNSGSISVTQTFLNGDRQGSFNITPSTMRSLNQVQSIVDGNNTYPLEYFEEKDFPTEKMIMQNPQALITRFYEGSYIPYKLPNPLDTNFINSGQRACTRSPFWIVGAEYYTKSAGVYTSHNFTWDYSSQSFVTPPAAGKEKADPVQAERIALIYQTTTGQIGRFVFDTNSTETATGNNPQGARAALEVSVSLDRVALLGPSFQGALNCNSKSSSGVSANLFTSTGGEADAGATIDCYTYCEDGGAIQYPKAPIATAHFSALNFRGNIKVMTRIGVEIVCNAGSLYTPFVHMSPTYDEIAIKNYIRVAHEMRDAFYGNSAAPEFRQAYLDSLLNVIWAPYVNVDFANRGASWTGNLTAR